MSAYRDFLPNAPRELNGVLRLPHRSAGAAVPRGAPSAQGLRRRLVLRRRRGGRRRGDGPAAGRRAGAPAARRPADAARGAPGRLRLGSTPPGDQWYWRADFVKEIPDEAVAVHAKFGAEMPTLEVDDAPVPDRRRRPRRRPGRDPVGYRDANWGSVFAGVDRRPRQRGRHPPTGASDYFEALHPYSAGGAYVNMMMDEGQERVRASYRDNYDRLARIKGTYDPDNLFRVNQNIQPQA